MLLLLSLLACSDYGLSLRGDNFGDGDARIQVEPTQLDFRTLRSGESRDMTFTVRSVGEGLLMVEDLEFSGHASFEILDDLDGYSLAPGDEVVYTARFTPLEYGDLEGEVIVRSNDEEIPEITVELLGSGSTPWLTITPQDHDFGALDIPCGEELDLTLQNIGLDDLVIDSWSFDGGEGQFSVSDAPELPLTLVTGAYTTVTVDFTPGLAGATQTAFQVFSNDPRGVVEATQAGEGLPTTETSDSFTVSGTPPVDILFAVDQSGSMDDDAQSLADNFSSFIEIIGETTTNWRIGVVTYDHGCFNHGVLRNSTSNVESLFAEAVQMGSDREIADDEALFSILDRALQQTDQSGECNTGFLRNDALLHIIVVSDEPERSEERASAWTWEYFLERFEAYPSDPSLLLISGVVDSQDCNEGDDGYRQAINTTGGERLSICAGNWGTYASRLAEASLEFAWTFELTQTPVASSIRVEVDGVELTEGWRYEAGVNSVVLDDATQGQDIVVTYSVATECN
ncbi:MAG: choice-of-anchor D domain-containing protein [Alphaproteobacteria bacterium]|nr:choice-of-anchor D domain-containing protein [Alphaproteobacteria bacterium]